MSTPTGQPATPEAPPQATNGRAEASAAHDWKRIANTPEFMDLHKSRQRFTLTGLAIETGALLLVMSLFGFAPDAMGKPAIGSITWALVAGTGLVLLTFVMAWAYAHRANQWEELSARAIEAADTTVEPSGRFAR
jgi:uncharacterized membrane protein (DUF485 family)